MPGHFTFYCNKIEGDIAYFDETESKHVIQVCATALAMKYHSTMVLEPVMRGRSSRATSRDLRPVLTAALRWKNQLI
ncbi:MAG: hypothetical protein RLZZ465_285 [Bacteroidota bacterium]